MIQLIAGRKGVGKTKRLLALANNAERTSDGHVVFIDDDKRHIYDLNYNIRFVETIDYPLSNYREFVGFVCGILSQDSDISDIFVDGLTNVIKNIDNDSLIKLKAKLDKLSASYDVNFTISMNCDPEELPDEIKETLI